MAEKIDVMDFMDDFLDEMDTSVSGIAYGDYQKVRLYPAYYARVPDDFELNKHFSAAEFGKKGAQQAAIEYLKEHNVAVTADERNMNQRNPQPCVIFRRYQDTLLNRPPPESDNDIWESRFVRKTDLLLEEDGFEHWGFHIYAAVEQSWAIVEYDVSRRTSKSGNEYAVWELVSQDTENAPLAQRWNQDLWAHVIQVANPTFDGNREETWNPPFNCTENDEYDPNDEKSFKNYVRRYPVIVAAFETKEELLAYMNEQGVELAGDKESSTDAFLAVKVTKKVQTWLDEYGLPWYNAKDHSGVAAEIHEAISDNGGNVAKVQTMYPGFPVKTMRKLAEIPPF